LLLRDARALAGAGIETHVICLRDEGEPGRESSGGVCIHRLVVGTRQNGHRRRNAFFSLLAAMKLLALDVRHSFRAAQVDMTSAWQLAVVLMARMLGARVIVHMAGPLPEKCARQRTGPLGGMALALVTLADKLARKLATRVVVHTRELRDHMGLGGGDVHKITVVLGVPEEGAQSTSAAGQDLDRLAQLKKEERRKGVFRVIALGELGGGGGLEDAVRSIHLVRDRVPGVQLRILGTPPGQALALARELGVADHVHAVGAMRADEVARELLAADMTLIPSRKDSYSSQVHSESLFEFTALAKPLIASRLPAVESYFPDEGVVYFEAGDPTDLADRLYYVFAHPEEAGHRVDKMNEQRAAYRWERERKKFLGVYQQVLERGTDDS
jgi:glycosyltransferase involved in cell wall biosynthesis